MTSATRGAAAGICAAALITFAPPAHAAHDRDVSFRVGGHQGAQFMPGARTQFWRVRAVDPRSGAVVAVTIWAEPEPRVRIEGHDPRLPNGHGEVLAGTTVSARRDGVELTDPGGAVATLERAGSGWRLLAQEGDVAAEVRLTRPTAGVRAGPWRVGRQVDGQPGLVRWATPAPLALAGVRVTTSSGTTTFESGRGYLDHTWGSVDLEQRAWAHWDLAQVALGPRQALVLHGLDSAEEISGPGSIDAVFRGVLVRVSRRGTRACSPRVRRRRWSSGLRTFPVALRARARCGGGAVTFDTPRDTGFFGGEEHDNWARSTTLAVRTARPQGLGTFDHIVWTP